MNRDFNDETTPYLGKQNQKKLGPNDTDSPRIRFTLSSNRSIRNDTFNHNDTPSRTRNKIDVNKTFKMISKHLSPSILLKSSSSNSGKHETEILKRKSDDQDKDKLFKRRFKEESLKNDYVSTLKTSKENKYNSICSLVEAYKASKRNYEACVRKNEKKASNVDVNTKRISKCRKSAPEFSSSYTSFLKSVCSSASRSPEVTTNSSKSLRKQKRVSDELSPDKYFKKCKYTRDVETKSESPAFNLSTRRVISYEGSKQLDLDCSSNSESINSSINTLNTSLQEKLYKESYSPSVTLPYSINHKTNKVSSQGQAIDSYEDSDKLFSRRKSCKSINSEKSGLSERGLWEISPSDIIKKQKDSMGNNSCNLSPWNVTTDIYVCNSSSSALSSKKGSRRVSWNTSSICLDDSYARKIKQESDTSDFGDRVSSSKNESFFNSSRSDNQKSSSYANLSSSKHSISSVVVYDECSSEEEMGWNGDYASKQINDSLLSPRSNKYSEMSFAKTRESDSSFSKPHPSGEKESQMKRNMGRLLRTQQYTFPTDLDSISNEIDLRLLGKHDNWIHSKQRNIFILGDSHTRFLVNGMKYILPGFKIFTLCKPSAKTEQVFYGSDRSISELSEDDFLILFCGTNDMWSKTTDEAERCMHKKLKKIRNTNILLCNVPRNYSESSGSFVQKNIKKFNEFLKSTVKKFSNITLVNLHKLKRTIFFTKHGLHFNGIGKVKICEILSHKLIDVLDKINPIDNDL